MKRKLSAAALTSTGRYPDRSTLAPPPSETSEQLCRMDWTMDRYAVTDSSLRGKIRLELLDHLLAM